jgi:low affinity Fe/Cu permease
MATQHSVRDLPLFAAFARAVEQQVGRSYTFVLAVGVVVVWAITGPFFRWSDTWQLIINTGTTIVKFLMVFVIQNTQSRDTQALHLKLDELIRVTAAARDSLVGVEALSEREIADQREMFEKLTGAGEGAAKPAPKRRRARATAPAR